MARMTEAEAEAADIFFTENDIMPVRGKPGLLAQRKEQMLAVDALSAQYFKAKAAAEHKTTMEVIGDMVRRELASV
ncbi:hypothetical protein AGMMS49579_07000 [Spirochaetia bacterium]|nr:hypothetical protein FACS1894163_12670 [Spirochaetia bacterium]GHV51516.1 hypothetical protein AGMMS49579_07000 [Spirochaetia bacterium]